MQTLPMRALPIGVLCAIAALPRCNAAGYPEQLWQTFRDRQAAAENASVTWEKESLHTADAFLRPLEGEPIKKDYAQPAHACLLLVSGPRARWETQIPSTDKQGNVSTVPAIMSFDGSKGYMLSDGREVASGVIQDDEEFDQRWNVDLFGLMFNLRPLEAQGIGPDPSVWSVDGRPAVIDGHECVVLTKPFGESFDRMHVDRNGDLLRRYEQIISKTGETLIRVDMQYDPDREPSWIPSSWISRMRDLGQSTNRVEEVELGIKIPDEQFQIEFPKRAYVSILSSREEARKTGKPVSEQFMIAGDNGELLPRRTEIAERTQIANESTTATVTSRWPLILAAVGAAALGVALLLWRRYARTTM